MAGPLSVIELAHVDVAGGLVVHAAALMLSILVPAALIGRAIQVDHLALTFLDEGLVLAIVEVTGGVEELADGGAETFLEVAFEDDAVGDHELAVAVDFVVLEAAAVNVTVRHLHLAFDALVVLPQARERRPILPGQGSVTLALTGFPVAFIGSFFVFGAH